MSFRNQYLSLIAKKEPYKNSLLRRFLERGIFERRCDFERIILNVMRFPYPIHPLRFGDILLLMVVCPHLSMAHRPRLSGGNSAHGRGSASSPSLGPASG